MHLPITETWCARTDSYKHAFIEASKALVFNAAQVKLTMGIPRLISYLQPYSVPAVLGCKTPQCSEHHRDHPSDNGKVVIDGPGFAFHVFYALLACKPPSLNPFDATPSYAEIGQAAIAFLQELRLYGLTMYKLLNISIWSSAEIYAARKSTLMAVYLNEKKMYD